MRHKLKTTIFVLSLIGIAFAANAAKVEDFMPKESVLYVQLQHIDEVYNEIETSETCRKHLPYCQMNQRKFGTESQWQRLF